MLAQTGWWQHIDNYCERSDPSFWAEPLNAWSNAAFWIAAALFACGLVVSAKPARQAASVVSPALNRAQLRDLWVLGALLVGIGVGSFSFHTYAVRWAGLLDVGFIVLWVNWYLWVSARSVLRWSALLTIGALVAHLLLAIVLLIVTQWFLMSYAPTALAAYLLALHASRFPLPGRRYLWACAIVFTLSMVFAGLDKPLCDIVPTGTHFLWHIFNATALLLGSIGLMRNLTQTPALASD